MGQAVVDVLLLNIGGFVAKFADHYEADLFVPPISTDSIVALLEIMSSSMLMIATFSVGSMVAAYASASTSATPRAFSVVVSDDVSKMPYLDSLAHLFLALWH